MSSKLREALKDSNRTLGRWREDLPMSAWEEVDTTILEIQTALAEPVRNCDVGTIEEQSKRFAMFCCPRKCKECPLYVDGAFGDCGVRWAQMPYKEGGAK